MDAAGADDNYSEAALDLRLRPSRAAAGAIAAMALACFAVAAFAGGPVAMRVLAATWAACLALEATHRVALHRGRAAAVRLIVRTSRDIDVESAAGRWRAGRLAAGSFVAPWLTVVRWRPEGARFDRTIVVLPDMIGAEEGRRLRVLLRWA